MIRGVSLVCVFGILAAPVQAAGSGEVAPDANLDDLLQDFQATAPEAEGSVRLDAWVQERGEGRELVVVVEPEGETKLVADPGITLTPEEKAVGVTWQVPVPHRVVEPEVEYWVGQRSVRLPFEASEGTPLDVTVEYAWCVLDYQCFFGEETLSIANRIE